MDMDRWTEDDYDAMSEGDCCEHGVDFSEECEECDDDPIGCLFPGKCLMPGEHLESECHTAEMMEQINADGCA